MTPEQWRRVNDLYHAALDLPPERRSGFVLDRASDDGTVAAELKRLLEIDPDRTAAIDRGAVPEGHFGQFFGTPILLNGDRIADRYRIERELGAGGMGQVYEAYDEELNARIALKIIRPELAGEPKVVARFKQEVQLARQVTHPNVCRAYDLVRAKHRERDLLFLCMEYVEGETLSAKLRRDGRMKLSEAEPIITQIAAGLQAAHTAGIVHRDLKCGNVFLSKDRDGELRVVLADFGLAGNLVREEGATQQTSTGWGIGTPAYMAPEQVEGGKIGPPADIYALGIVMYEMATGHVPYEGQTPLQVAVRRLREKPRPPRELDASVDPKWESAILRCLEIDPADRFSAASAIPAALRQGRLMPRAPRRQWRRRAGAVAAMVLVAAGAGVYWGRSRLPEFPPQALSWYQRGMTSIYDGNWPEAETAFAQAIKAAPAFGAAYARRAEALIEMQKLDPARASLLEGIGQGQFTPEQKLHHDATLAYLNRDTKTTLALLKKRVEQAPEGEAVLARLDLGAVYGRLVDWKGALPIYEQITELDPGNARAWIQLGRAYTSERRKEWRVPFERVEALLQRYPDSGVEKDLFYHRASCAEYLRTVDALPLTQVAVAKAAVGPNDYRNVRARMLLVKVLEQAGDKEKSKTLLAEVRRDATDQNLDRLLADRFNDLGWARAAQGRIEEAISIVKEAIQIAENVGAPRTLALSQLLLADQLLLRRRGRDVEEAQRLLETAADNRRELVDLRLRALRTRLNSAEGERDLAGMERLGQTLLREALKAEELEFAAIAYYFLGRVSRSHLRLNEFADRAQARLKVVEGLPELEWRLAASQEVIRAEYYRGNYDAALRLIEKQRKAIKASPVNGISTGEIVALDRIESVVLSEMGKTQAALALINRAETNAGGALARRRAELNRCTIQAEAHLVEANAYCKSVLQRLKEENASPGTLSIAKQSASQAAYWAKDYGLAASLAAEARATAQMQQDRYNEWVALLTLAAAQHKLGKAAAPFHAEIGRFLSEFEQANGRSTRITFTGRRPFREFLDEIGYPFSTN